MQNLRVKEIIHKPLIVLAALAALLLASAVVARAASQSKGSAEAPAISARYLYDLTGFGTDGRLNEPNHVVVDGEHGEVFVADTYNHRVKIFNDQGMLLFQFGSEKLMRLPSQIAVDGRGLIYVLHSSIDGPVISVFNYRGVFLRKVSFEGLPLDVSVIIPTGLVVDKFDNLYVVDDQPSVKRILVFDHENKFLRAFRIMADLDEKQTLESFCGQPFIGPKGTIYVSNPMVGTVYVYSSNGEFLRTIGVKGSGPGKLAFPVAVSLDNQGHVMVLDRMRHNVVVYDLEGRFVSEFGGFGMADGWFYSPNSLAVDPEGRIYVSQIPNNRVQVLKLTTSLSGDTPVSSTNPKEKGGELEIASGGPKNAQ